MPLKRRALRSALLLVGGILVVAPEAVAAQGIASVRLDENFRREPNGVVLARLNPGTPLQVVSTQGNWTEVVLEGWVWLQSLGASDEPEFDLVVAADGGENLRSGPAGTILARLEEGALLEEVETRPAWARARRSGWVWSASLAEIDGSAGIAEAAPTPSAGAASGSAAAAGADAPPGSAPSARAPGGIARVGREGGAILTAPDGDTMAVASPDSDLEVVRREGSWARVRVEGWMWLPSAGTGTAPSEEETARAAPLEPADLAAEPESHAGRVVQWDLLFISLERAEAVRTDFFQGEPFLLARYEGSSGPFVYVAIPTDRLTEVDGLVPLERISITGRVRTGSSALTGAPIVDLITIERLREDR